MRNGRLCFFGRDRDPSRLCWCDEHECEKWLTESPGLRYAQVQDKGWFSKYAATGFVLVGSRASRKCNLFGFGRSISCPDIVPKTSKMLRPPYNSGLYVMPHPS
jgi:hypothetical protein